MTDAQDREPGSGEILPAGSEKRGAGTLPGARPNILVCLDRTEFAERVLPYALTLAGDWNARITLLYVLEPRRFAGESTSWDPLGWEVSKAEAQAYLEEVRDRLGDSYAIETHVACGAPAVQIVATAQKRHADLTILATRGLPSTGTHEFGTTTQMVSMHIPSSLLVVPTHFRIGNETSRVGFRRIALALDGSLHAESGLPLAARIAREHDAQLTLYHVATTQLLTCPSFHREEDRGLATRLEQSNLRAVERYFAQLQSRLEGEGLRVGTFIQRAASAQDALAKTAFRQRIDLLVVSDRGQTGNHSDPHGSVARYQVGDGLIPLLLFQGAQDRRHTRQGSEAEAREAPQRMAELYREDSL